MIAEYSGEDVINIFDGQEYEMFECYVETDSFEEAIHQFCNNLRNWDNYNKFFSKMEEDINIEEMMIDNYNNGVTTDSDYSYDEWVYSVEEFQKNVWRIRFDITKYFLTNAEIRETNTKYARKQVKEEIERYIDYCYEYGNDTNFYDYAELNGNVDMTEEAKELIEFIQPDLENVCKKLGAFSA